MSQSALRKGIIVTLVVTGFIHLVILNISFMQTGGSPDVLFSLNGLGYFALLAAFLGKIPQLIGKEALVRMTIIGYGILTIVLYFVNNGLEPIDWGYITKFDELLLVIFTWMYHSNS